MLAAANVEIDDETYDLLSLLEVEGILQTGLLTTRPMNVKKAERLIREAEGTDPDNPFIIEMIKALKKQLARGTRWNAYLGHADSNVPALAYNNDGDVYNTGSNLRIGFLGSAEYAWTSFTINLAWRHSDGEISIENDGGIHLVLYPHNLPMSQNYV